MLIQSHSSRLDSVEDVRRVSRCIRRAFGRRGVATHRVRQPRSLVGVVWSDRVSEEVRPEALNGALNVHSAEGVVSKATVGVHTNRLDVGSISSRSPAILTPPSLLPTIACAGADGSKIFFLPLVAHVVHFSIIITGRLMWFTLEFSLAIAQTGAAHHVTVLSLSVPPLTNTVVVAIVVAPFGGVTSEVSAAEAQASAPQLEAGLRHALPLLAHVVISGGEGVVAGVPVGREPFGDSVACRDDLLKHLVPKSVLQGLYNYIV